MCEHSHRHAHGGCGCYMGGFERGMGRGEYGCCRGEGGPGPGWEPRLRFHRRLSTREERITRLEEYLKDLQAEAKAVEERLARMKASS